MKYEPVIGLEVHVELKTRTKMFCDSLNDSDEKHSNINVCPICMGHPGTLPVINQDALKKVILAGLALNCEISEYSFFERKNYFYPDLPKGYQISQYQKPLCRNGYLEIGGTKIRIERIHLEEDTGRLVHSINGDYTLVDYNRAGMPLMELVTFPDVRTGEQVRKFGEELQLILRYLGVSDADMQKGQMRVEVNISLRSEGQEKFGTKAELKNINSFKYAAQAVDYEIKRQEGLLGAGKKVIQETRGWDESKQVTFSQRSKEDAHDYRYFPEPDLPPFDTDTIKEEALKLLPELPSQRRVRFYNEYKLPTNDVEIFVSNRALGDYFEQVISELKIWDKLSHLSRPSEEHLGRLIKLSANYLITELQKLLYERGLSPEEVENIKITPENFAEFIVRVHSGEVSSSGAQILLREMLETGAEPKSVIKDRDLGQVSDLGELAVGVKKVISQNTKAVEDFKKGKTEALKFLIGQVMMETKGKANPTIVEEILKKEIS